MKTIILACGSGIATSTAVAKKIESMLDTHGFANQYHIIQCSIQEAADKCANADLLVATTVAPTGIACPFVSGVPFLTGIGQASSEQKIIEIMAR